MTTPKHVSSTIKAVTDALWPILGGNHLEAEMWQRIQDAVSAAIQPDPEPMPVKCPCTMIEQDESCPVGYPSLLCDDCNGIGILPATPSSAGTVSVEAAGWQPIETAPQGVSNGGKLGVTWMMLAVPDDEGGFNCLSGMRVGDKFYAAMTFYCGGPFDGKQFEKREVEVNPTHWMPLPDPPALRALAGERG